MIQYIKNLFRKNNSTVVESTNTVPVIKETYDNTHVIKEVYDDFGQIELDHNIDKNYAYYLNELKKGATHYRIIEDNKKNYVRDLDDMEDYYCYLTIEIFYKNKTKAKRYSVMGDCTHATMQWNNIPSNATKENIDSFVKSLDYTYNA